MTCCCGTDPDASDYVNWDSSCPTHGAAAPRPCRECGHVHAGPALGGICVGCPCPVRSIGVPVQANADMYPDAGVRLWQAGTNDAAAVTYE